jgi:hypothetical protein
MKRIRIFERLFFVMTLTILGWVSCCPVSERLNLTDVGQVIRAKRFVDLTHAFSPRIPHWPGFPDEKREILYWYKPGVGRLGSDMEAMQNFPA